MLLEEIIMLGLVGALTALITSIVVTRGKNTILLLFMILLGACSGWISGMIWVYLTGGLDLTIPAMILPIFFTLFFSMIALHYFKDKRVLPREFKTTPMVVIVSIVLVIALAVALVIPYLPAQGETTPAEAGVIPSHITSQFRHELRPLTAAGLSAITPQITTAAIPLDVEITKSSVSFPRIAENPDVGNYLAFEVTFTVSQYDWKKPIISIIVLKDGNENGVADEADSLWPFDLYKYPTNSGTNWRCYVFHYSDVTVAQYWALDENNNVILLPSFHSQISSPTYNEQGQTLYNTPEGFVCPNDMISVNTAGEVEDQMTSWVKISKGSTATIQGKIYIPDDCDWAIGQHLIHVIASDYDYGDIAYKDISFTVNEPGGKPVIDITVSTWVVAASLITGTFGAASAVVIYGPKF